MALALPAACQPPSSVQAVDRWLTAYAAADVETMVAHTAADDREYVRRAMTTDSKTSSLALALPPPPLSHEILEIERKDGPTRHVVLCRVKMKNPLPYMSEKVGQDLKIPKTRTRRRRFLSVRGPDGRWGVKLDLRQVLARTRFVRDFREALRQRNFVHAEAMLTSVPASPDEANVQSSKDRLAATLAADLRAATSTSAKVPAALPEF